MNKNILHASAERILGAKEHALQIGRNVVEKVITPNFKERSQAVFDDALCFLGGAAAAAAIVTSVEAGYSPVQYATTSVVDIFNKPYAHNLPGIVGHQDNDPAFTKVCPDGNAPEDGQVVCPTE
jgi:hypothetical protein